MKLQDLPTVPGSVLVHTSSNSVAVLLDSGFWMFIDRLGVFTDRFRKKGIEDWHVAGHGEVTRLFWHGGGDW